MKFAAIHKMVLGAAAVAVLVVGCGGGDDVGIDSGVAASDSTAATTTIESTSQTTSDQDAAPPAPSTSAAQPVAAGPPDTALEGDPAPACHDVEHLLGTSCVPVDPVRILAYDPLTVLPTLLALDVEVAGTVSPYSFGASFVSYLDPADLDGIEIVGAFDAEPNIEAIAAFAPDLIIGSVSRLGEVYDQVSQIAPTVVTGYAFYETDWRKEILLTAESVGAGADADRLLAELDEHIEAARSTLTEGGTSPTISRVDVWQGTPLYYQFDCVWFGELLTSAGVSQPGQQASGCDQEDPSTAIGYLSLETIDLLDADAIVAYQQQATSDDVGADPTEALAASPLWADLPAVQNDRVFVMGDAWGLGGSIQAAHHILDELVAVVFGAQK